MGETNYDLEQDLNEAKKMVEGLETYVLGDQVYGSVGGGFFTGGALPSLTIGALLLRVRRLRARDGELSLQRRSELDGIEAEIERVHREWTLHFNQKIEREAASRLKAMGQYFEEMREDPRTGANAYLPEALRRTIIAELAQAIETYGIDPGDLPQRISSTDASLRRYTEPALFIWSSSLEPIYPKQPYWWLYVRPRKPQA
ncbi:MAG TPA: hypothetical protein VER79_13485 [Candidatus Limnocylindrales bacterium]|nr:hypothetical protein [Candidatus Limnocylindrales bacterium]